MLRWSSLVCLHVTELGEISFQNVNLDSWKKQELVVWVCRGMGMSLHSTLTHINCAGTTFFFWWLRGYRHYRTWNFMRLARKKTHRCWRWCASQCIYFFLEKEEKLFRKASTLLFLWARRPFYIKERSKKACKIAGCKNFLWYPPYKPPSPPPYNFAYRGGDAIFT